MDILIRNVPKDVVDDLDAQARQEGLTRQDYLRDLLTKHKSRPTITEDDWHRAATATADLSDPDIMAEAWR